MPAIGHRTAGRAGEHESRQVLARQDGPVIVAGHSYGGQILTALGAKAQNVVGLVYIAAFGLDEGESIGALLSEGSPEPGT